MKIAKAMLELYGTEGKSTVFTHRCEDEDQGVSALYMWDTERSIWEDLITGKALYCSCCGGQLTDPFINHSVKGLPWVHCYECANAKPWVPNEPITKFGRCRCGESKNLYDGTKTRKCRNFIAKSLEGVK